MHHLAGGGDEGEPREPRGQFQGSGQIANQHRLPGGGLHHLLRSAMGLQRLGQHAHYPRVAVELRRKAGGVHAGKRQQERAATGVRVAQTLHGTQRRGGVLQHHGGQEIAQESVRRGLHLLIRRDEVSHHPPGQRLERPQAFGQGRASRPGLRALMGHLLQALAILRDATTGVARGLLQQGGLSGCLVLRRIHGGQLRRQPFALPAGLAGLLRGALGCGLCTLAILLQA